MGKKSARTQPVTFQEKVDSFCDTMFNRYHRAWIIALVLVIAVGIPFASFMTVADGIKVLDNGAYSMNIYFLLPFLAILAFTAFSKYTKRLESRYFNAINVSLIISFVLSSIPFLLALPGMPLETQMAAIDYRLVILMMVAVQISLLVGLVSLWYEFKKYRPKATFKS